MTNKTEARNEGELAQIYIEININIDWSKISKASIHTLIETIKGLERSKEEEEEAQAKEDRRKQWNHLQEEFGQVGVVVENDGGHNEFLTKEEGERLRKDTEELKSKLEVDKLSKAQSTLPALEALNIGWCPIDHDHTMRSIGNVNFIPSYTTDPRLTLHDDNAKPEPKYTTQELAAIGCSRWRVFYDGKPFAMTYASPGEANEFIRKMKIMDAAKPGSKYTLRELTAFYPSRWKVLCDGQALDDYASLPAANEFIRKQKALAAEPLPLNSSTEIS